MAEHEPQEQENEAPVEELPKKRRIFRSVMLTFVFALIFLVAALAVMFSNG